MSEFLAWHGWKKMMAIRLSLKRRCQQIQKLAAITRANTSTEPPEESRMLLSQSLSLSLVNVIEQDPFLPNVKFLGNAQ